MKRNEEGITAEMRVERVEEPAVFGFTWGIYGLPADDRRRTHLEFTLEPAGAGTRLTVVQTGFAQLPEDFHARRTTATPTAGRRSWASWSPTSMPDDIEAIAGQVFAAWPIHPALSWPRWSPGAWRQLRTWPWICRSPGRPGDG
jgi:hypothetical protein